MLEFVIKRKVTVSMLFIGLTLLGYISYRNLPVQLMPDATLPYLIVMANSARDTDPKFIERDVIVPIEGAVGTLEGIEEIRSFANRRQGVITVSYSQNTNMKYAYLRLQEKLDAMKSSLPEEYFVAASKVDTEQLVNRFMTLQVRGTDDVDYLRYISDMEVVPDFESMDGIASVQTSGGRERSVEVVVNNEATEAFDITPSRIAGIISRYNQYKTYVGYLDENSKRFFINVSGEYTSVWDLENIVVDPAGPVLLKDVAEVRVGAKKPESYSRINGKESVTLDLIRDSEANILDLAENVYPVIDRLNSELADEGVEIVIQNDTASDLQKNIDLVVGLAIIGGILAILILWFFLENLRLIFVIALSLPISIFTAFNLFYMADISINSLTLVGMALAVGMLLDNSVVVLENIYRLMQRNADPLMAATEGVREIWRSIVSATLTTICVFIPFIFSTNLQVTIVAYQIGVSIISTLLVSLAVALLLIPMVTHYFMTRQQLNLKPFYTFASTSRMMQLYTLILKTTMRFPIRTVVITLLIFFSSLLLTLGQNLFNEEEAAVDSIPLYITMAAGASLETTDIAVRELEAGINDIEEIKEILSQVFEDEAILTLQLKENYQEIKSRNIADIKSELDARLNDYRAADVSFDPPNSSRRFGGGNRGGAGFGDDAFGGLMGLGSNSEKITVKGDDLQLMRSFADDIVQQLTGLATVDWAWVNEASNRPELHLDMNETLLSEFQISPATIRSELNTFQPETGAGVKFRDGLNEYDIQIKNESYEERDVDDLRSLPIPTEGGGQMPLSLISDIAYSEGNARVSRLNQERQVEVSYRFEQEVRDDFRAEELAQDEVDQLISIMEIPDGIALEVSHAGDAMSDVWAEFLFTFAVAFILVYMILASVFESLLNPLIIMFTIPLAAIGSLIAILVTGYALLNINVLIGMLILLGIVVNNGIILIDYAGQLRRRGFRFQRALLTAGQARLRPILITAITTIVALMPLAMGKVEYVTQLSAPFAITVIGGLIMSTVFTLVLIPTVYSGLESLTSWFASLSLPVRLLQIAALAAGSFLIYYNIDSNVWKFINFFVLLLVIPAVTFFVLNSLRKASSRIIDPNDSITISIKNLHKIYDYPGRFTREWRKYDRMQEREGKHFLFERWSDLLHKSWHFMLWGFFAYFVFFYLKSGFWMFVLAHPFYFYTLHLYRELAPLREKGDGRLLGWIRKIPAYKLLLWGMPFVFLIIFMDKWDNITMLSIVAFLWYFGLIIYSTSNRLHQKQVDINRISGRFSRIRKMFYRLVQSVPVIGKKKVPFPALNGVSLEIGNGMFGLLGPNGAGKTTLMRTICGILDQTYGSIRMNEFDVKEKREELQGLIGYLPQDFGTYENMSAFEFLNYQAILKGLTERESRLERIAYVLSAVHLEEKQHEKIGSFSGGMKQRVGIAQTLLHLPRILVVDEPTAGLDPRERIRFRNLLVELSRERIVIFSTHVIEDIASSCDRVAVMNKGQVRYLGRPQEMADFARGKVWQFLIEANDFEAARESYNIVHHSKADDKIKLRCLAPVPPVAAAEQVTPTLEDAYLWLLSEKKNGKRHDEQPKQ